MFEFTKKKMNTIDYIYAVAIKFFDGTITYNEEKDLFDWINLDTDNRAKFDQWEEEWIAANKTTDETRQAWNEVLEGIQEHEENQRKRVYIWKYLRAAAAILVLMVLSATATWIVSNHQEVDYYTFSTEMGSKSRMTLPDGSEVWLNAGSVLRYSSDFNRKNRSVELLEGEGYFHVKKQGDEEFTVKTQGYDIVVKGTKFNISAYKSDNLITTALIQGKVEIKNPTEQMDLIPGEMVSFDRTTGRLTKGAYRSDMHAWVDNKMEYESIRLDDLARVLSRQYAVNISIASQSVRDTRITVSLRNKETIDDVTAALERIAPIKIKRNGKELYIHAR